MKGLFLCPTPIGNLEDITLRTLKVLKKADVIACEDTRTSRKLLDRYNISAKLTSYHKFNYKENIPKLLDYLTDGKTVALITDAGMPGISDPGSEIIKTCIEKNIEFTILPGPSASILAVVYSGLDANRFTFIGFLSEKSSTRKKELEEIKGYRDTLIFYEAPHRIKNTLIDIKEVFGNRKIAICREMTKLYEEIVRGDLFSIVENIDNLTIKGEFVLVVEGATEEELEIDIKEELIKLLDSGYSKKDAVKKISEEYNLKKNDVYQISLEL